MGKKRRVLIIGDLHEPFTLSGYMDFCLRIYKKYKCNVVIFIGDIIDNHFSSFYDVDPDGHSAGAELYLARKHVAEWYEAFPNAIVTLGNHDKISDRKAFNAGISREWIKPVGDVLETPDWDFCDHVIIDNVKYCHGIGKRAFGRMREDMISIVQGHYHTNSEIRFVDGHNLNLFSMQVGCGFDRDSYAAAYAKHFTYQAYNVGVVLENGTLPIIERM